MTITREKFKIEKTVFDYSTIKILRKFEAQGFIEVETLIPLFMGKESNVFVGEGEKGQIIVKIYRIANFDFKRMYDYLKLDRRIVSLKKTRRGIIFTWVKREYRNLLKAREAGVKVPTPYAVKDNVLLMELIGEPAMKVKDVHPKNPQKFYDDVIKQLTKLLKAKVIHADLSSFNILNYDEKPVFIDFSQSTTIDSARSNEYFERDLRNVNNFFKKIGAKELKTLEDFHPLWSSLTK